MDYFKSTGPGHTLLIVFDRGDLLLEGIQEVVRREGIETAVITGGIGSLSRCNLHLITVTGLPPKDEYLEISGAVELGSVQGTVLGGVPHVHVIVSDYASQRVHVGHLEPGSRVCYRAEVSLQTGEGIRVESYQDEATGLARIRARR